MTSPRPILKVKRMDLAPRSEPKFSDLPTNEESISRLDPSAAQAEGSALNRLVEAVAQLINEAEFVTRYSGPGPDADPVESVAVETLVFDNLQAALKYWEEHGG